jgi:hypothetical protein
MNRERLEALLWERIDATISGRELSELETALAAGADPRRLEHEVADLAGRLSDLRPVAPPADLRTRIDEALNGATAAGPARSPGTAVPRRRWSDGAPRWLPLAACLLLGIAVGAMLPMVGDLTVPESQVAGTMGADRGGPSVTLDLGGGRGTIAISRDPSETRVDLHLVSDEEIVLSVRQPGASLAVSRLDGAEHSSIVAVDGGSVSLRTSGPGLRRLGISGSSPATALRLEVTAGGTVVLEHRVEALSKEGSS